MSQPQATVLPAPPVERLVRIIDALCKAIAARGAGGALTLPLLLLLWQRLRRIATQAIPASARLAAGVPQAAPRRRAAAPRPLRPPVLRLPRGFAWLVRHVPGTAAYGLHLQSLLADPLMAPLLATPKLRGMLNPLCQMLGVPKPPPRPSPGAATPAPRPPTLLRDGGETPAGCDAPSPAALAAA